MSLRRNIIGWASIGAGLLLRIRAVPPAVSDVDGVNFARALEHFDPLHQAPHLFGYPVYVLATKLCAAIGLAEVWSLVLPALILFPIGALLFERGLRHRFGETHSMIAASLVAFAPFAVTSGGWPSSDGFGFALLLASIGLALLDRPLAAGAIFGLMLGARLSWWPLLLGLLFLSVNRKRFAVGFAATTLSWIGVLCLVAPPLSLLAGTLAFGQGHLAEWGLGSVGLLERLTLAAMLAALALVMPRHLVLTLVPYGLWILFAQNLDKPRHLLPLLPGVALALGAAVSGVERKYSSPQVSGRYSANGSCSLSYATFLGSLRFRSARVQRPSRFADHEPLERCTKHTRAGVAFAGLCLSVFVLPAAIAQGTEPAPAVRIARELASRSPERLQVFAGESARVIGHLAPAVRVWRPASAEVLMREAKAAKARGAEVFIVSDAPGAAPADQLVLRPHTEEAHASR